MFELFDPTLVVGLTVNQKTDSVWDKTRETHDPHEPHQKNCDVSGRGKVTFASCGGCCMRFWKHDKDDDC